MTEVAKYHYYNIVVKCNVNTQNNKPKMSSCALAIVVLLILILKREMTIDKSSQ